VRETFVAVVIGNLPMIYPVVSRQIDKIVNSSLLSRYNKSRSSSNKTPEYKLRPTIGSERARERGGRKGVRSLHQLPTTYHECGSDEAIVGGFNGTSVGDTITEEGSIGGQGSIGRQGSDGGKKGGIVVTRETDITSEEGKWKQPSLKI